MSEVPADLIEKIRKEESQKLHAMIERLKEENTTLSNQVSQFMSNASSSNDPQSAVLAKLMEAVDKIASGSKKSDANSETLSELRNMVAQITTTGKGKEAESQIAAQMAALKSEMDAIRAQHESATKELTQSNLKLWRLQAISEYGQPVIEEMVTGSTPDEIRASVKTAGERYAAIAAKILGSGQQPPQQQVEAQQTLPPQQNQQTAPPVQQQPAQQQTLQQTFQQQATPPVPSIGSGPAPLTPDTLIGLAEQLQRMSPSERVEALKADPNKWKSLAAAAEQMRQGQLGGR